MVSFGQRMHVQSRIYKLFARRVDVWRFQGHIMSQLAKVCEQCARETAQAGRHGDLCHFMLSL